MNNKKSSHKKLSNGCKLRRNGVTFGNFEETTHYKIFELALQIQMEQKGDLMFKIAMGYLMQQMEQDNSTT